MMIVMVVIGFVFFFSSRRRHTRCGRDWNSDVCSSDLRIAPNDRAAGAVGAAADRDLGGIALHVANVFERDVEPLMHELREHGGVPLAVRMRPAQDGERSAGIEA